MFRNVTLKCLTEIGKTNSSSSLGSDLDTTWLCVMSAQPAFWKFLEFWISAGVQVTQYEEQFVQLFTLTMHQLRAMLPVTTNIKEAYKQGSNEEQNFIQNLSLFLCTFLKEHGLLIERKEDRSELLMEVWILFLRWLCAPMQRSSLASPPCDKETKKKILSLVHAMPV